MPIEPVFSAASCKRREAVIGNRTSSATTNANPPKESPSSIAESTSSSRSLSQKMTRSECRPACESAGKNRSGRVRHQRHLPSVRAAIPATNSAAAAPSTVPLPPPATSCSAPYARPPPGNRSSISAAPNGSTLRGRALAFPSTAMRSRSSAMIGLIAIEDTVLCRLPGVFSVDRNRYVPYLFRSAARVNRACARQTRHPTSWPPISRYFANHVRWIRRRSITGIFSYLRGDK